MSKKVFFYHYSKPASLKAGKPQISIHYNKTCYIVDNLKCNVKTWGHLNKRQPRFVVKGLCSSLRIVKDIAYID